MGDISCCKTVVSDTTYTITVTADIQNEPIQNEPTRKCMCHFFALTTHFLAVKLFLSKLPMSEYYLDATTYSIVYGYLKYRKAFSSDLISVTISYVGDHFMPFRGGYTWFIEGAQLCTIKNSPKKQMFTSKPFEIAGMLWQFNVYPNGINSTNFGSFLVYLKLISKPPRGDTVVIQRKLRCSEFGAESSYIATHQKGISLGWNEDCLSSKQVRDSALKRISITVDLCVLRIVDISRSTFTNKVFLYQHRMYGFKSFPKQHIEWNLNPKVLDRMRESHPGKQFESGVYHQMWSVMVYPRGLSKERMDHFEVGLQITAFPKDVTRLRVRYQMFCEEFGIKTDWIRKFDICSHAEIGWLWADLDQKVLSFQIFKERKLNRMTIVIEIEILDLWHNNGSKIMRRDWNKYMRPRKS